MLTSRRIGCLTPLGRSAWSGVAAACTSAAIGFGQIDQLDTPGLRMPQSCSKWGGSSALTRTMIAWQSPGAGSERGTLQPVRGRSLCVFRDRILEVNGDRVRVARQRLREQLGREPGRTACCAFLLASASDCGQAGRPNKSTPGIFRRYFYFGQAEGYQCLNVRRSRAHEEGFSRCPSLAQGRSRSAGRLEANDVARLPRACCRRRCRRSRPGPGARRGCGISRGSSGSRFVTTLPFSENRTSWR